MGINSRTARSSKQKFAQSAELPKVKFVLDNGAFTMKAGFATCSDDRLGHAPSTSTEDRCHVIPNAIIKDRSNHVYIAAQANDINDWNLAQFRRPLEKGYLVNWESEREIWDHSFFDVKTSRRELRISDPSQTTILLTEAPNATTKLQSNTDEIIMEEWGFGGYARCLGPSLIAWDTGHGRAASVKTGSDLLDSVTQPAECLLVIDSGYSQTTVTPLVEGRPLQRAIRRLELGGKHLTNYLKELISLRQLHMLDETHIVNEVKEAVCFVSADFAKDTEEAHNAARKMETIGKSNSSKNNITVDYVLPDPVSSSTAHRSGFMRPHDPLAALKNKRALSLGARADFNEDVLTLANERFMVPEILMSPDDIGIRQGGIHDLVMESLSVLPTSLHPSLLCNVLLVGGNAMIPGLAERIELELRSLVPSQCIVRVRRAKSPITSAWSGGCRLASNNQALQTVAITRQEYLEHGSGWAARRFSGLE